MSDQPEIETSSAAASLKEPIRKAVEQMNFAELSALIAFAEGVRREKKQAAQQQLVTEFRERATQLGFSFDELISQSRTSSRPSKASTSKKAAVKYRGPNGEEWSGRGRTPAWITALEAEGKKREEFGVR